MKIHAQRTCFHFNEAPEHLNKNSTYVRDPSLQVVSILYRLAREAAWSLKAPEKSSQINHTLHPALSPGAEKPGSHFHLGVHIGKSLPGSTFHQHSGVGFDEGKKEHW